MVNIQILLTFSIILMGRICKIIAGERNVFAANYLEVLITDKQFRTGSCSSDLEMINCDEILKEGKNVFNLEQLTLI